MGLAGRKQKQRIPADPRNLSWADDASRFGHSYLSKFGWDASQGLGPSGDGMKAHLKVQQKLDMMGIGAQHQRDPNGLAWKQNKEFEALLKKLNQSVEQRKGTDDEEGESGRERETAMDDAFVRAQEEKVEGEIGNDSFVTAKKRKQKDRDGPDSNERIKKKPKKEKRQKSSSDDSAASAICPTSEPPSALYPESIPKPRPMAHRARVRAAKRIAGKPASAISEILGIAPSSSVSPSTSTPVLTPPSTLTPAPPPSLSLDNLTTSTKSVVDYFKEKLLARSSSSFPASSSSAPSGSATPGLSATGPGLGLSNAPPSDDDGEPPRRGIGSRAPPVNADDQDVLTEKQRRKAEKRKRREAEATQATPGSVSTDVKGQIEEDDVERLQRTTEKHKQKKRREREQQAPTDQPNDNNDDIIKRSHEHDTQSGSLPEPSKKSKKEHRKKLVQFVNSAFHARRHRVMRFLYSARLARLSGSTVPLHFLTGVNAFDSLVRSKLNTIVRPLFASSHQSSRISRYVRTLQSRPVWKVPVESCNSTILPCGRTSQRHVHHITQTRQSEVKSGSSPLSDLRSEQLVR